MPGYTSDADHDVWPGFVELTLELDLDILIPGHGAAGSRKWLEHAFTVRGRGFSKHVDCVLQVAIVACRGIASFRISSVGGYHVESWLHPSYSVGWYQSGVSVGGDVSGVSGTLPACADRGERGVWRDAVRCFAGPLRVQEKVEGPPE